MNPWNTEDGLYYLQDCTLKVGADFYCPHGWAYAENRRFECHNPNVAIWHDGPGNRDAKTVLNNCSFTGDDIFKLGRFPARHNFTW